MSLHQEMANQVSVCLHCIAGHILILFAMVPELS